MENQTVDQKVWNQMNVGDYCTCKRCPCCGKLVQPTNKYNNPFPYKDLCNAQGSPVVKLEMEA